VLNNLNVLINLNVKLNVLGKCTEKSTFFVYYLFFIFPQKSDKVLFFLEDIIVTIAIQLSSRSEAAVSILCIGYGIYLSL